MANFIKAHGLSIANGGYVENAIIETLTTAPASLEVGRLYYDSTASELKYVKADGGVATVKTFATKEDADAFKALLDSTDGAAEVGVTGVTGVNGEFSITDGDVQVSVDAIVAAIDAEIKARKNAITTEANARTAADTAITTAYEAADTAINATITALKDGSESTIADLDGADAAQVARLVALEDLVDGDMGDMTTLTTDHKDTLVGAINEVDANADATAADLAQEISDRETAITDLTTYTDTNFVNKTTSSLQSIVADVNMGGSLTVTGDLTVNGGNFVTEAEVVTFADNVLTLNSNVTTGAPTENAGLEVSRGDEGTLSIFTFNELNDYVTIPVWDATANEGAGAFVQDEIAGKTWAGAEFLRIEDATAALGADLQAELDLSQASAGLTVDGEYVVATSANYIATATTLHNATVLLDTQAKTTADALAQEISDRESAVTAEETARIAADTAEETARIAGDDALDARVTTVEEQVNGKIGELSTLTNTDNDTGLVAENIVDAINDVDADLSAEVSRATGAEAAISGVITALKDGSTSTIKNLDDAIALNTTNLNQEISDRQAAITAEQTARENADSAINSTITALKDGSTSTIADLDTAIADEVTRATGAEATINTTISTMKTDINAMYYTFTADVAGSTFNIAHNLNSEFVSVQVWVYDDATTKWKNDIVAIEIVDNANLNIYLTESRKVKVIVSKIANLA